MGTSIGDGALASTLLDTDAVAHLAIALDEATRAGEQGTARFVEPAGGTLARAVLAATVGWLGSWAVAAIQLLTPSCDPGGGECHATNAGLDPQPGRWGAQWVRRRSLLFPGVVGAVAALWPVCGPIQQADASASSIQHVLVISIDGMHALDLANYVASHPNSTLARLSSTGDTFTNASASKPSDALPGLLAMTTGGSPQTTGVWYDDAYDRTLSPPGSNCSTKGTEVIYDQTVDFDPTKLDGGGGINPANLPLDGSKGCTPVYPHSFLRVNTIFEVVTAAGRLTAWADDHPSYDILNGPSGTGVQDLYTPEISSTDGTVAGTEAYDDLKVQAILNEIDGKDHSGTRITSVPALFGMNFEAVNVAQRLAGDGYLDAQGTPSAALAGAFDHIDQSLGTLVAELGSEDLLQSTMIIITAKHGQAPIDPSKRLIVNRTVIPNLVNSVQSGLLAQATQDDVSLLWLTDESKTNDAVATLKANPAQTRLDSILYGTALTSEFDNPLMDARTPDIIGLPSLGVIYTNPTSTKLADFGGFSDDDTHVPLLVSNPALAQTTVDTPVHTTQIAPTILALLGLAPSGLQAENTEPTPVLPLPPGAVTGPATNIGAATATLNGTVSPRSQLTVYSFRYGTTTAYGASTPSLSAGSGAAPVAVSADLSGLARNTTYHFRIVATNDTATTLGDDRTFTTSASGGGPGGGGGGGQASTVATLSALGVSPHKFVVSGRRLRGHCRPLTRANGNRPRCTRPLALQVSYTLDVSATVTFTLKRAAAGRLVKGRCVRPTRAGHKDRRCARLVPLGGSLVRASLAGANSFTFSGLPGAGRLAPGSYELIATPTASGRGGQPRTVNFKISP
jgi:hypothetical protein